MKPKQQATVAYSFIPADAFAGRPIGLSINLQYRDASGNMFIDSVFNETVQIVEFDEGFDTELHEVVTKAGTPWVASRRRQIVDDDGTSHGSSGGGPTGRVAALSPHGGPLTTAHTCQGGTEALVASR